MASTPTNPATVDLLADTQLALMTMTGDIDIFTVSGEQMARIQTALATARATLSAQT